MPYTQPDHRQKINHLSPLIYEMHIHQQNHWNDIIFYWYQLYHWYQWTIGQTIVSVCVYWTCVAGNLHIH